MRVSREQFAENRERIVQVASTLFREKGFDGIGVADIMKSAGLTHGGFYGHFESKDDLSANACRRAAAKSAEAWNKVVERTPDGALPTLIERYLSVRHRDNAGTGCLFAALGAEAARQPRTVRRAFAEGLQALVDILAKVLPAAPKATRRSKALSTMSEMVGAMVLARAVDDPELSAEILSATAQHLSGPSAAR